MALRSWDERQARRKEMLDRIYADPVLAAEYEADLAIQAAKEDGPEQEEPDFDMEQADVHYGEEVSRW